MIRLIKGVFCIMAFVLAACQTVGPSATALQPTSVRTPATTPLPNKATAVGRVLSLDNGQPFANMDVRLAEVLHLPANNDTFMLNDATSPGAYSDAQGYFTIANVMPKDYVVIVGDVNLAYGVPTAAPDKARVWKLTAGTITDMGELRVVLK